MQHTKRLAFAVEMRSPTSGDEDDDQYGSEAQVETQEKMGSELSHKYQGPEWDGKKESYTEWRWEATPYLDSLGLESVRRGRNRSVLTTSASSKEAVTMVIALNKLFRVILRMIKRAGTEAKALRCMRWSEPNGGSAQGGRRGPGRNKSTSPLYGTMPAKANVV